MKYSYEMVSRLFDILSEQLAFIKYLVNIIWQMDCADELKRDVEGIMQTIMAEITDALSVEP